MKTTFSKSYFAAIVLPLCMLAIGCKSGKSIDFSSFGKDLLKAPEKKTETSKKPTTSFLSAKPKKYEGSKPEDASKAPSKIISIWKQGVLTSPAGPIRGFAGRIYFHGRDDLPCKIDGELTIYAFNDRGKAPYKETEAFRKFIFRRQDLPSQHSISEVGHSYSVWLPFDKIGGPDLPLALMPIFRDAKTGKIVQGKQSVCMLRGSDKSSTIKTNKKSYNFHPVNRGQVNPVAYESEANPASLVPQKKTITRTLTIPRNAKAIKDASNYKSANTYREDLIQEAHKRLQQEKQEQADPVFESLSASGKTDSASDENTTIQSNGTTSRWENAVQQFRGTRRPNSMGGGF